MMKAKEKNQKYDESLRSYFDQIKNIPLLTFEEEQELSRRIHGGDEAARRRLIESNLRLVVKIARSYLSPDVSWMDLIQEGNMGLMHAITKYEPDKQIRFATYAAWWIRQAITRYLCNKRRIIRLPHRKEEILLRIRRAYYSLSQRYMRKPKAKEISAEIGIPQADVEHLLGIAHNLIFTGADWNGTESAAAMDFHEDYTYSPERALMRKSSRESTLQILNQLKDREKRILIYRYQLNGGKRHTLKNISREMGLSPETVRQIEVRALKKLRTQAEELKPYIEAI